MKIKGKKIEGSNVEICVIPRGENEPIVFKCQAVLDMEAFDKLCPPPKAPLVQKPGGRRIVDVEDPKYIYALNQQSEKRIAYILLRSLEATEDLEWETVKMSDPDTWSNYEKELTDSGFSRIEVMRILNTCMSANCLDEARLEKARNDFLAGQRESVNGQSTQVEEPHSMLSGELVKD